MPIYAYRCSSCGFEKDHLQKLSDPALTVCPQCHQNTYGKRLTAACFQLKGSGWYATDFKGNAKPSDNADKADKAETPAPSEKPAACQCCPGAHTCADN